MFRTVFFDCDTTLSAMEGIDELAREYRDQIVPLTEAAMRGEVALESVYARRLAIIRPSRAELERVGRLYVERLVPGAREVVAALQQADAEVHIISGGLRPAVLHVADALGVPHDRVHAVDIRFDEAGQYAGFDESSPLTRDGGKPVVITSLGPLPRPMMLVGDGNTDLEAKGVVDCFVGFAGVVARPRVVAEAHVVVHERSLFPVLALALDGPATAASHAPELPASPVPPPKGSP
ncbi:MAG: HAD-IB family phosphatase [Gemmatimonadaceae bacterium]|nr:HAD-IB family phosphatase [Gemmatimonadaceae bacterium]